MASEAQVILDRIKKLTRVLQKTEMFSTDPVAQKLNSKFTGLLGKLSSYVNQNTATPTPDANAPKVDMQSPTRPQAPQGQKVPARTESINETKLREYIRNLIINELTDAEKEEKKADLDNQVSDLQGQVAKIKSDAAKKSEPLQKKVADLQKEKEKVSKMATK
jgi:type I restriction-modification system DNA methylase subunit